MEPKITVIGGGSWGTALTKILHENLPVTGWWLRDRDLASDIRKSGRNARYLSSIRFDTSRICFYDTLEEALESAGIILLVVPSAYIEGLLSGAGVDLRGKTMVSAVKGLVTGKHLLMVDYLKQAFGIAQNRFIVISGPSHSEEVAMEKLTYLTFAGTDPELTNEVAACFKRHYLKPVVSEDIYGTEYAAVLKNIFAIAAGMAHGLGYGDNFLAVLLANATQELKTFIDAIHPIDRDIKSSAYLGDLLVTAYSQFSRNRTLGTMIGKGYRVQSALLELGQVAEGYYAARAIHEIATGQYLKLPITESVFRILYEGISPRIEFKLLSEHLK